MANTESRRRSSVSGVVDLPPPLLEEPATAPQSPATSRRGSDVAGDGKPPRAGGAPASVLASRLKGLTSLGGSGAAAASQLPSARSFVSTTSRDTFGDDGDDERGLRTKASQLTLDEVAERSRRRAERAQERDMELVERRQLRMVAAHKDEIKDRWVLMRKLWDAHVHSASLARPRRGAVHRQ